jgi:glucan-binding YG repeat protein
LAYLYVSSSFACREEKLKENLKDKRCHIKYRFHDKWHYRRETVVYKEMKMKRHIRKAAITLTASLLLTGSMPVEAAWQSSDNGWWNTNESEAGYSIGWEYINGSWYYFDNSGWMQTGWLQLNGTWSYLTGSGAMATGWYQVGSEWYYSNGSGVMISNQWVGDYYVGSSGAMLTEQYIGNYYVGTDGKWIPEYKTSAQGWVQEGNNWYYYKDGVKATGWLQEGGNWYYLKNDGLMQTGWLQLNDNWYYLNASGQMQTDWYLVGNFWYYSDGSGVMLKNQWIGDYYVGSDGNMLINQKIGNYYVGADGKWIPEAEKPAEGWVKQGSAWYYYQKGVKATGWLQLGGNWYYLNASGQMQTGWYTVGAFWYYSDGSGVMLKNQWVGDYYVGPNGDMLVNQKIGDDHVGPDGKKIETNKQGWVKENGGWFYYINNKKATGWIKPGSSWYYLKSDGMMVTGWLELNNVKYYLKENDGAMLIGLQTIGNTTYYFDTNSGALFKNGTKTVGTKIYTFDGNGACVKVEDRYVLVNGRNMERQYQTDPQVSERDLLAALIQTEAGGEKQYGQIAVGVVLVNRIKAAGFPNNFKENIYWANQFEPARTGVLTKLLRSGNVNTSCKQAADIVLAMYHNNSKRVISGITLPAGKTEFDYLYFMTPAAYEIYKKADDETFKVDGHMFFNRTKW